MGPTKEEFARIRARLRAAQTDMLRRKAMLCIERCPACRQMAQDYRGDVLMASLRWHTEEIEEEKGQ